MAGYYNYSMSNNAVDAYGEGKMPLSKWTKTAILEQCTELLANDERSAEKMQLLKNCTLAQLKAHILTCTEWHHTSKHYNATDFYAVDDCKLDELTPEDVAEWKADKPQKAPEPTARKGTIYYLEWTGTRNHPRAKECKIEDVEILEKGSFYIVSKDGKQILKKKKDSRGTEVIYS